MSRRRLPRALKQLGCHGCQAKTLRQVLVLEDKVDVEWVDDQRVSWMRPALSPEAKCSNRFMAVVHGRIFERQYAVWPRNCTIRVSRSSHFLMATVPIEDQLYVATPFARVGTPGSQESKLHAALQLLAELTLPITEADGAAISLAEEGKVLVRASAGNTTRQPGARIDKADSWSDLLLRRTLESIFCVDTEQDRRVNADLSRSMQIRSMIVLPLYGRGSLVGVLEAYWQAPYGFTNREIGTLTRIGELVLRAVRAEGAGASVIPRAELQAQNYPTVDENLSAGANTKSVVAKDLRDLEEHQPALVNPATGIRDERRTVTSPPNRIEVVITPNELEEELTTLPVDRPAEERIADPRKHHQWGVIGVLVFAAMLTAGIWWRVEASQAPQGHRAHPSSAALAETGTNQSSTASDSIKLAAAVRATPDSAAPTLNPAEETPAEISSIPSRITGIHYSSSSTGGTLILDLEGEPTYQADTAANPTRVFFDLQNTSLSPALSKSIPVNDTFVARIRTGRLGSATRIVFDAKQELDFRAQMTTNPSRMIIDLRNVPAVK